MPDDMMHGVVELIMGEQQDDKKAMLRTLGTGRRILCLTCATQLMQWIGDGKMQFTLQMRNSGFITSTDIPRPSVFNWRNDGYRQSSSYFQLGDN